VTQQPDPSASREGDPEVGSSVPPPDGVTPPPAPTYGQPATPPPPPPPAPGYQQAQPGQQGYGAPVGAGQPLSDSDERMWAMLGHVGGIVLGFIAPLVTWLVFRERSAFVDDQGKEALNFQITILIGYVVGTILSAILIGFLLLFIVWIVSIVFAIMAGIAANRGERYRYPVTLRLIK
jgi:uncharacterized protein